MNVQAGGTVDPAGGERVPHTTTTTNRGNSGSESTLTKGPTTLCNFPGVSRQTYRPDGKPCIGFTYITRTAVHATAWQRCREARTAHMRGSNPRPGTTKTVSTTGEHTMNTPKHLAPINQTTVNKEVTVHKAIIAGSQDRAEAYGRIAAAAIEHGGWELADKNFRLAARHATTINH